MLTLLFLLWTSSQQICAAGKGKTISQQPLILQWKGSSLVLAGLFPVLCPVLYIFCHILFSTIHLCFHSWFYNSMLHPHLLSNSHFVEDTAVLFSLLPSNSAASLQSFACAGWFISLHTSMPAWALLLSFQTGIFLCCILPLHFPRFFGIVSLYFTLLCYSVSASFSTEWWLVRAICIKPWLYHIKISKSRTN